MASTGNSKRNRGRKSPGNPIGDHEDGQVDKPNIAETEDNFADAPQRSVRTRKAKSASVPNPDEQNAPPSADERDESQKKNAKHTATMRLTVNEALTLIVAITSLAVSYMTYRAAADSSDIKHAVNGLAELAAQTKRQADGQAAQLKILKAQADQASLQTLAISGQTDAIKSSSIAAINSAKAQIRSADLATSTQRPRISLSSLQIEGFEQNPDESGNVTLNASYSFSNVGGSTLVLKGFNIYVILDDKLPVEKPTSEMDNTKNNVVVESGKSFGSIERAILVYHKSAIERYNSGKAKIFAFGRVDYSDMAGNMHSYCYAFEIISRPGRQTLYIPTGGNTYHCDT